MPSTKRCPRVERHWHLVSRSMCAKISSLNSKRFTRRCIRRPVQVNHAKARGHSNGSVVHQQPSIKTCENRFFFFVISKTRQATGWGETQSTRRFFFTRSRNNDMLKSSHSLSPCVNEEVRVDEISKQSLQALVPGKKLIEK